MKTACIIFDGPYPTQDNNGDEVPYWSVFAASEDGEPTSRVYECHTYTGARALAQRMARDRRVELAQDAIPA